MISPSQRPLPDNTQHSQQTNIHAPGGIWTHNLRRRAAADLRLRPRGYCDRLIVVIVLFIKNETCKIIPHRRLCYSRMPLWNFRAGMMHIFRPTNEKYVFKHNLCCMFSGLYKRLYCLCLSTIFWITLYNVYVLCIMQAITMLITTIVTQI